MNVGGFDLPGMIYTGRGLAASTPTRGVEPALIDPSLRVDAKRPDHTGETMGYWPAYDQISPGARAGYLSWLAGGRRGGAYIGYVFLFFYGLERRALVDSLRDPAAKAELPAIGTEVRRLIELYRDNRSFYGYATAFADTVDVLTSDAGTYDSPPPEATNYWEMPARLKVGLAQLAVEGKPMPADWALAWVRAHPDISRLRTPARRCPDEFEALFAQRYRATYGDGLVVKPNKTKLTVNYRPASAGFGGTVDLSFGNLPDVSVLTAPVQRLRALAATCTDDLDSYSRWLGKNEDGAGSLAAIALLPADLVSNAQPAELEALRTWADWRVGPEQSAVLEGAELIGQWSSDDPKKLNKAGSVSLCQVLERAGFGVEPDARLGGDNITDKPALLFRLNGIPQMTAPSAAYAAASVLLHLAVVVSAADGTVSEIERHHLVDHIESAMHLSAPERERLRHHLEWLIVSRAGTAGVKKRLAPLDQSQRSAISAFLVGVVGADGSVAPAEIDNLRKIFTLLGLDPDSVYSQLHALGGTDPGPVTVRPARPVGAGQPIPAAPAPASAATVVLDPARVKARMAESEEVAALIATVFVDDEPAVEPPVPEASSEDSIAGLDEPHAALVAALTSCQRWTRDEIAAAAAERGLLPDGALDTINEAVLDLVGEPLLELTDDVYEVNGYALGELMR